MSLMWAFMDIHNLHHFMPKEPNAPKGHKPSPLSMMQTKDGLEEPAEKEKQWAVRKFDSADGKTHYTVFE